MCMFSIKYCWEYFFKKNMGRKLENVREVIGSHFILLKIYFHSHVMEKYHTHTPYDKNENEGKHGSMISLRINHVQKYL